MARRGNAGGNGRGNATVTAVRPTKQRLAKGDLERVTEPDHERVHGSVTRYRARDSVAILLQRGTLGRREAGAAMVLRSWAHDAALQGINAQDYLAAGGGAQHGRVPLNDRQLHARQRLHQVLALFGGPASVGGSLLVRVICEEASVQTWVTEQAARGQRSLTARHGVGALVVALGVVAVELDRMAAWGEYGS